MSAPTDAAVAAKVRTYITTLVDMLYQSVQSANTNATWRQKIRSLDRRHLFPEPITRAAVKTNKWYYRQLGGGAPGPSPSYLITDEDARARNEFIYMLLEMKEMLRVE